jgi:rhamnosyltransferase
MAAPSVIVRVKDERDLLERSLRSLREQTVDVEIVVVDSGSTDGSLEVARRCADTLIEIPPSEFTFGRALNIGAEAASGDIHFALSSHCRAERRDWVERALAHYSDARVAGTHGCRTLPDRRPLLDTFLQDAGHAREHPYWGFSNHASSWRAELWTRFPFHEAMEACEDKEWAWRVMDAGYVIAVDPLLDVTKDHRQLAGTKALYARTRREAEALAQARDMPRFTAADALRKWFSDVPRDNVYPPMFHRLNYYRAAEIAGRWAGERRAGR